MGFLVPKSKSGMIWRAFFAAIIMIACGAATTAVAGLLQVDTLVQIINIHPGIKSKKIKVPPPGAPQTILLIGSDHRPDTPFNDSRTDTMLLMRLNPHSSTINVMSIPRDLEVTIPGVGTDKLNAAYSSGGYGLLIDTIQKNVFPAFQPNHVIDVNFGGFSNLIDAIGCVYSDVDHRYYNQSEEGANNYSSIDIEPGYQKLCGHNQSVHGALPFVRFRHTDSDIVRNARQQDFLRWAKAGFSGSKLFSERQKLITIFAHHSTTDQGLHSNKGLLSLLLLLVNSDGTSIKQIPFPAILPAADSLTQFVTADPDAERTAYKAFMHPTPAPKAKPKAKAHAKKHKKKLAINPAGLSADPLDGLAQAKALTKPRMPVYYPRLMDSASEYCTNLIGNCENGDEPPEAYLHSYPRQYVIPDSDGKKVPAYRMTVEAPGLDLYYGIQGVHWKNPPLLSSPSGTEFIHGRKLFLYKGDGSHLTTVAFHVGGNTYWVSNTLSSTLPNSEMIGIAASMLRYHP